MYEAHWGLNQAPFQNVPDPGFFCPFTAHQEILGRLLYVVHYGKGGALLTGDVGCGKSTLSRVFLVQLEEAKYDVGIVVNPSVPPEELLYDIALQLNLTPPSPRRASLFRALNDHLLGNAEGGKTTVLVIDEAHTIRDRAAFEDVRLLMNLQLNERQLLAVILIGAPELRDLIEPHRSLAQRLAIRLNLGPLVEEETILYIDFRVKKAGGTKRIFTNEAIKAIHRETGGIPRSINNLCELCLFEGFRRKATKVDESLVKLALAFL